MTKQGQTLAVLSESIVGEANPNLVPEVHSIHGNVAEAIVIKNGNLFFLSEPDGKAIANTDVNKNARVHPRLVQEGDRTVVDQINVEELK